MIEGIMDYLLQSTKLYVLSDIAFFTYGIAASLPYSDLTRGYGIRSLAVTYMTGLTVSLINYLLSLLSLCLNTRSSFHQG